MDYLRRLLAEQPGPIDSPLGQLGTARPLPRYVARRIPLVVTGSSRQSLQWLVEHADGCPSPTALPSDSDPSGHSH